MNPMSATQYPIQKIIGLSLLLFLLGPFSGKIVSTVFAYTLEYTQEDLQKKIEKKFPYLISKPIYRVELKNPHVILKEGEDRIGFKVDVSVTILERLPNHGSATLNGKLRYEASSGKLFLDDPKLQELLIEGAPPEINFAVGTVLEGEIIKKHFATKPLYELKEQDLQHTLAKLMLKSVAVKDGKLLIELDPF